MLARSCDSLSVTMAGLTRQLRAATLPVTMLDRSADPADTPSDDPDPASPDGVGAHPSDRGRQTFVTRAMARLRDSLAGWSPSASAGTSDPLAALAASELAGLSVAGLTRRRVVGIAASLLVAWIMFAFVQQVGEAAAITARADALRAANLELEFKVVAAQEELVRIQGSAYIEQQARGYRLGTSREIPFVLEAEAPPLGPDAPGSAGNRVGAEASSSSPLESWLSLLFGPIR